jgi:hypothetical protein
VQQPQQAWASILSFFKTYNENRLFRLWGGGEFRDFSLRLATARFIFEANSVPLPIFNNPVFPQRENAQNLNTLKYESLTRFARRTARATLRAQLQQ